MQQVNEAAPATGHRKLGRLRVWRLKVVMNFAALLGVPVHVHQRYFMRHE